MRSTSDANVANASNIDSRILSKLEKLRQENRKGHSQTKMSLTEKKATLQDLKKNVDYWKRGPQRWKAVSAPLKIQHKDMRGWYREIDLTARCEDLQNRS